MSLQVFTLPNPQIIIIYFLTGATSGSTNSPGLYCLDLISLDKASLHADYRLRYLSTRSSLVLVEVQNKFLVLLVVNTLKLGGVGFFHAEFMSVLIESHYGPHYHTVTLQGRSARSAV